MPKKLNTQKKSRNGDRRATLIVNKAMRVNHKKIAFNEIDVTFAVQGEKGKHYSYKQDNSESKENLLLNEVIDGNSK